MDDVPAEDQDRISILAVDDRADKLLSLEAMLSDMPVNIVRADSGSAALRWLLRQEFALVLLDVNMPGMDGFETARLIRERQVTQHLPIIFVTAYEDEVFMVRGYALGAVDYILQPVVPEILRSKISVFVDLFRKNRLVEKQVRWQQQRALQLQRLAQAAVVINAAPAIERMLQLITETAREIMGAHQAMTLDRVGAAGGNDPPCQYYSLSDKYVAWRGRPIELDLWLRTIMADIPHPVRLSNSELQTRGDWARIRNLDIPPVNGVLTAPLVGRDGRDIGWIYLSDKAEGEFTADDEAIILQLSQMGAVAIENLLNAEAREANRAKDQFIAVLSHELRTPLTPVLGMLAAMTKDPVITPALRSDLEMIRRNVLLEARLIDDLLDMTRISKGKVELQLQTIDMHELLREAVQVCQADLDEKQMSLTLLLKAADYHATVDATRLRQVFWNLLKNATKFTPPTGRITVATSNTGDRKLRIAISDTGVGIRPEVLPRIFTAFEQGPASVTRQFGGLGLGLAISKALVEMHHGVLEACSEGQNRGATFYVTIPVCDKPAVAVRVSEDLQQSPPPGLSVRLLLVEDHLDTAAVMERLLRRAGYEVDVAVNVSQAIALSARREHHVVLSDISLPDGTGLELMTHLRERGPILGIALSGFGMEYDVKRSREAGFTAHLTKPVDSDVLLGILAELITRDHIDGGRGYGSGLTELSPSPVD